MFHLSAARSEPVELVVFDCDGRAVYARRERGGRQHDVTWDDCALPAGLYVTVVRQGRGGSACTFAIVR